MITLALIAVLVVLWVAIALHDPASPTKATMRCPFHHEVTASCLVREDNSFLCLGCGASGYITAAGEWHRIDEKEFA